MYVFSANATAKVAREGVSEGQQVPFMVYINFVDLFGAEQLCKIYLMRAGFTEVEIEKRKFLSEQLLSDGRIAKTDEALQEAMTAGYFIRMFDE